MSSLDEGPSAMTHLPYSPLIIALISSCVFHVSITVGYLSVSLLAENEDAMYANLLLLSTCNTHPKENKARK